MCVFMGLCVCVVCSYVLYAVMSRTFVCVFMGLYVVSYAVMPRTFVCVCLWD